MVWHFNSTSCITNVSWQAEVRSLFRSNSPKANDLGGTLRKYSYKKPLLEELFTLTLKRSASSVFCTCEIARNPPLETSRDMSYGSCVFTYRMVRITRRRAFSSLCSASFPPRLKLPRENSQPLSARRNAQPLGRAFTLLSRDERLRFAFANAESWSWISFSDNVRSLLLRGNS